MNEKINILNIELYQTSAKAAMQKVVQYMESDSINTVEIITMDMLLKGKDMPGWKEAVESLNLVLPKADPGRKRRSAAGWCGNRAGDQCGQWC